MKPELMRIMGAYSDEKIVDKLEKASGVEKVLARIEEGLADVPKLVVVRRGRLEVLKIGKDDISAGSTINAKLHLSNEVDRNIEGYRQMKEIGASDLVPDYDLFKIDHLTFLLMEHLGDNLEVIMRSDPAGGQHLLGVLSNTLSGVYRATASPFDRKGEEFLKMVAEIGTTVYGNVLQSRGLLDSSLERAGSVLLKLPRPEKQSLAIFDFQPSNIFVRDVTGPNRVKLIDPKELVIGLPMIDIACLTGVLLYKGLSTPDNCRPLINMVLETGIEVLGCRREIVEQYFYFGRAIQLGLSATFNESLPLNQRREMAFTGLSIIKNI